MRYTLLPLAFVSASCSNIATYPPVESEFFLSSPNSANEPVPTIVAEVISYAHDHYGGMDIVVFNLPEGVNQKTFAIVSEKLDGAIPLSSKDVLAYHILELRVRGFTADADILFPSDAGEYEMATVHLESTLFAPWGVVRDRVWLVPVREPPPPTYVVEDVVDIGAHSQ